MIHFIE